MPLRQEERYTPEEAYQRRIDTGEWHPNVMTEEERLEARRMDAGSAFEMQWQPKNKNLSDAQFNAVPDAS